MMSTLDKCFLRYIIDDSGILLQLIHPKAKVFCGSTCETVSRKIYLTQWRRSLNFERRCNNVIFTGFPTFIYFNYYKIKKEYDGGRTAKAFIKFLQVNV